MTFQSGPYTLTRAPTERGNDLLRRFWKILQEEGIVPTELCADPHSVALERFVDEILSENSK